MRRSALPGAVTGGMAARIDASLPEESGDHIPPSAMAGGGRLEGDAP